MSPNAPAAAPLITAPLEGLAGYSLLDVGVGIGVVVGLVIVAREGLQRLFRKF